MKKYLLLLITASIFFACSKGKEEAKPVVPEVVQSTAKFEADTALFLNQDLSIVNKSENATSYTWDFGDGTTSTEKEPKHKYATAGTYSVKLTTNGNSTVTNAITVHPTTHSVVIKNNTSNSFKIILFDKIDENTFGTERFKIDLLKAGEISKPFFTNKTKIGFGGWTETGWNFVCLDPPFNIMAIGNKNVININPDTKINIGLVIPN